MKIMKSWHSHSLLIKYQNEIFELINWISDFQNIVLCILFFSSDNSIEMRKKWSNFITPHTCQLGSKNSYQYSVQCITKFSLVEINKIWKESPPPPKKKIEHAKTNLQKIK